MGGGLRLWIIRGHGGITHFGNSEGRGELKYGSRLWYGMDIFWNCPMCPNFLKGHGHEDFADFWSN